MLSQSCADKNMPTKGISSFYPQPSALSAVRSSKKSRANIHREDVNNYTTSLDIYNGLFADTKFKASEIRKRAVALSKQHFNETVLNIMAQQMVFFVPEEILAILPSLCRHSSFTFGLAG